MGLREYGWLPSIVEVAMDGAPTRAEHLRWPDARDGLRR